jgi:predicted  nucleic acid-binding Zn-ribbon protein
MSEIGQYKQVTNADLAKNIGDLASAVASGFADTASKKDIKGLGKRMDGIEERIDIVENKLDKALYHEFERVDRLEQQMGVVYDKLGLPKTV